MFQKVWCGAFRIVRRLGPLLALEAAPRPVPGVERLWIVDGTLVPVRDRSVGARAVTTGSVAGPH
nr:hypothetical protein KitaXyl93_75730 [Kitasatospora sp. Xyl93]